VLLEGGAAFTWGHFGDIEPPLHLAVRRHDAELVRVLLAAGADINAEGERHTALFEATALGDTSMVRLLLSQGAMVDGQPFSKGITPLIAAVRGRHVEAAGILLEAGASVAGDILGDVPVLSIAADSGSVPLVRLLLDHGADANIRDSGDWAPLHFAAWHGRTEVVRILLGHGADVEATATNYGEPVYPGAARKQDIRHSTPLHLAAWQGNVEIIRLLLRAGARKDAEADADVWGKVTAADIARYMGRREAMALLAGT
jgi:ankyrin repeat protein